MDIDKGNDLPDTIAMFVIHAMENELGSTALLMRLCETLANL